MYGYNAVAKLSSKKEIRCPISTLSSGSHIQWYFGSLELTADALEAYGITRMDFNDNSILKFNSFKMNNAGLYKCKAKNILKWLDVRLIKC